MSETKQELVARKIRKGLRKQKEARDQKLWDALKYGKEGKNPSKMRGGGGFRAGEMNMYYASGIRAGKSTFWDTEVAKYEGIKTAIITA